jgi:acetylornithine deacetylase/succinyl-diaminopimelate desuccinylase-like protein
LARSEAAQLVAQLVAVDSVNPGLIPGAAGESELARFVAGWCEEAALEVEVEEAAPGRPNVIATARGAGGGRSLLLNGHTDTVGVAGMERPYEPRVDGGRLYGRGAYDMKGGLAAIMLATARAAKLGLRGDVIMTAVVDEELASIGTEAVVRSRRADAAIVAEPTELRVCVAHRGFAGFEIETAGRAAHGSRPDLGVDAIARMGRVLVGLEELDRGLRAGCGHPLLGTGSVHASLIEGGQEFSSYPARCLLSGERRTVPGETLDQVERELAGLLGDLDGSWRVVLAREPLETSPGEPIVELVRRHAGVTEVGGVPFWTDGALLSEAGTPTVVLGPGGKGAHAVVEWVELGDVERCADIYLGVAVDFCA